MAFIDTETTGLSRDDRIVKRSTKVVGIFPNEEAITRLVGAIFLEQKRCKGGPSRSIYYSGIAPVTDDPLVGLPDMSA